MSQGPSSCTRPPLISDLRNHLVSKAGKHNGQTARDHWPIAGRRRVDVRRSSGTSIDCCRNDGDSDHHSQSTGRGAAGVRDYLDADGRGMDLPTRLLTSVAVFTASAEWPALRFRCTSARCAVGAISKRGLLAASRAAQLRNEVKLQRAITRPSLDPLSRARPPVDHCGQVGGRHRLPLATR